MRTFHIYTDSSSKDTSMYKDGVKRTTKVGVIVVNSCIIDIYYNRKEKYIDGNQAEAQAIIESVKYVKSKYDFSNNIIISTDAYINIINFKSIKKLIKDGIKIIHVKGHKPYRRGLKYKFNCLADWISRNGINTWKNYYYRHLLK